MISLRLGIADLPTPHKQASSQKMKMARLSTGFARARSWTRGMTFAAVITIAGVGLMIWTLERVMDPASLASVTTRAALSLLLSLLVGWIIYLSIVAGVRAQNARNSEERFQLFVEGAHEYAIILLDREGKIVSWNAGAERIKGFSAEQIMGQPFTVFYTGEDVLAGKPAKELKLAEDQGRWEGEGWRVRADGSKFWASVLSTPLRNEAGNLRGFSKLTRDISQRKQAEEAALKASTLQKCDLQQRQFLKYRHRRQRHYSDFQ